MSDTITLRQARPADIDALDRLFQRSYMAGLRSDYAPSVLVTAVPVIGRAQPALIRSGRFHVAERGEQIVGAGGWSLSAPGGRPGTRGIGHIRHVATDPAHLRRGVGRRLLQRIMTEARASGMARLHCQSTLTAVPFYKAMGFAVHTETVLELAGGIRFPAVFMTAPP